MSKQINEWEDNMARYKSRRTESAGLARKYSSAGKAAEENHFSSMSSRIQNRLPAIHELEIEFGHKNIHSNIQDMRTMTDRSASLPPSDISRRDNYNKHPLMASNARKNVMMAQSPKTVLDEHPATPL